MRNLKDIIMKIIGPPKFFPAVLGSECVTAKRSLPWTRLKKYTKSCAVKEETTMNTNDEVIIC